MSFFKNHMLVSILIALSLIHSFVYTVGATVSYADSSKITRFSPETAESEPVADIQSAKVSEDSGVQFWHILVVALAIGAIAAAAGGGGGGGGGGDSSSSED